MGAIKPAILVHAQWLRQSKNQRLDHPDFLLTSGESICLGEKSLFWGGSTKVVRKLGASLRDSILSCS
jgi:hypothetical protein